jgi:hypothetical protein
MSFTDAEGKPLLDMLNRLFAQYGFELRAWDSQDLPDIATWEISLAPTITAEVSINLNPALAPDTWSLEPTVMVYSAYAGRWYNALRLYRDFYPVMSGYEDHEHLQVLRFSPAHIRWQEKPDLDTPALKGRLETIGKLRQEFVDVFEHHVMPVLAQFGEPLALAEFQLRAETAFRSTRVTWDEPRYKVSNPYISTALLFDEAGQTAKAVAYLEQEREKLFQRLASEDPARTKPKFAQLDRLLEHLRNKMPAPQPGT